MWMSIHAVRGKPQWTQSDADSSRMWAGLMYGGYGTGAALLLTSGALWILTGQPSSSAARTTTASVTPLDNGATLSFSGRW